jgi:hypothetical protein
MTKIRDLLYGDASDDTLLKKTFSTIDMHHHYFRQEICRVPNFQLFTTVQ